MNYILGEKSMFTGLIEEPGKIVLLERDRDPVLLHIEAPGMTGELRTGDSVAVNGACLTVVRQSGNRFQVEVSREPMSRTNLGTLKPGDVVNLERSLRLSDRLGGHIVLGHVDGTGTLDGIEREGGNIVLTFSAPEELGRYIVDKGSIAIDGISLTPYNIKNATFSVSILPLTMESTNLKIRKIGDTVNIEVDILAKYIESLLNKQKPPGKQGIDLDFLEKSGFV